MADGGTARRSGLGRGLQALLPEAGEQPPAPDAAEWFTVAEVTLPVRLAGVVDTGLALLRQSLRLDVCAYAHTPDRGRPRMWIADRAASPFGASGWSELGLVSAGLILTGLRGPRSLEVAGMELLAIPSRGPGSSGIHLVGRSRSPLDDRERSFAIHLVQALGEALHGLDDAADDDPVEVAAAEVSEVVDPVEVSGPGAVVAPGVEDAAPRAVGRAQEAVLIHWPEPDVDRLERVAHEAVHSSGVRHSELSVSRALEGGAEMLDVSAAHRGDLVRVVLPADGTDPAVTAARAGRQAARILELIGVPSVPREEEPRRVAAYRPDPAA